MEKEEILQRVIEVFKDTYGEEFFDYTFYDKEDEGTDTHIFKIHYPEIDIVSFNKETHKIKNLFLSFKLYTRRNDFTISFNIAEKQSWTPEEYYKKYLHSHIGTSSFTCTYFCLGDSNEINNVYHELACFDGGENIEDLNKRFDTLEIFLHLLNQWSGYESTNTTPYFKIKDLKLSQETIREINPNTNDLNSYLAWVKEIPLIQNTSGINRFTVLDNDLFKQQLYDCFSTSTQYGDKLMRFLDENGIEHTSVSDKYLYENQCKNLLEDFKNETSTRIIKFKDKELKLEFLMPDFKDKNNKEDNYEKVVSYNFRKGLKDMLEKELNKFYYDAEHKKYTSKAGGISLGFHPQLDYIIES